MAPRDKSRRSFFVELLSTAAGTWVAVSGLLGLASAASGCSDDVATKYGGPKNDAKYGGPPDGMTPKYGVNFDMRREQPVVKYGGPGDMGGEKPVVKYGGPGDMRREGPTTKYGGRNLG